MEQALKVLMISMDRGILDRGSESYERMRLYATVLGKLDIIILNAEGSPSHVGNIKIYPTSCNKFLSFFIALTLGWKLARHESFDVISTQDPFATGVVGFILKKITGAKSALQIQIHTGLFTPYFLTESIKTRFYVSLAKYLLPRADCIKVVSESIKDYLVSKLRIKPENITVLPVFVFFDKFLHGETKINLKEKYPQFDFILLMASRLVWQKNISLAIRAMKTLREKYPCMGLLIVGSGPYEENLMQETQDLNLRDNIIFEPWCDDLVSYYKTADLFLLTSDYEGWARTVLEAMASGLPVIMTDVGVAGEIVKNGENGIVVPVKDETALTHAIEDLYRDDLKREKLRRAGRETILNSDFRNEKKYLKLYLESFGPCLSKK